MELNITPEIRVVHTDPLNFQLQYKARNKNQKTGEDVWNVQGYFSSVAGALREIVNRPPRLQDTGPYDLEHFAKWMEGWVSSISLEGQKLAKAAGTPLKKAKPKVKRYVTVKPRKGAIVVTLT